MLLLHQEGARSCISVSHGKTLEMGSPGLGSCQAESKGKRRRLLGRFVHVTGQM